MRVVLYAYDFEPITILDLDAWSVGRLREARTVLLVCPPQWDMKSILDFDPSAPIKPIHIKTVRLDAEPLRRMDRTGRAEEAMLLFTADEESALLLKSVFLPGQYKEVHEREQDAGDRAVSDFVKLIGRTLGR